MKYRRAFFLYVLPALVAYGVGTPLLRREGLRGLIASGFAIVFLAVVGGLIAWGADSTVNIEERERSRRD